jgi:hypothetical protein
VTATTHQCARVFSSLLVDAQRQEQSPLQEMFSQPVTVSQCECCMDMIIVCTDWRDSASLLACLMTPCQPAILHIHGVLVQRHVCGLAMLTSAGMWYLDRRTVYSWSDLSYFGQQIV